MNIQRLSSKIRLSIALLALALVIAFALMSSNQAMAHVDHNGAGDPTSTGNSISLQALRSGVPIVGSVVEGETIHFEGTLGEGGQDSDVAIQGGTFGIKPPDFLVTASTDVTPGGGVPCLGGTAAPCNPAVVDVLSDQLAYIVDCDDADGGFVTGEFAWTGGFNHNDSHSPASASTTASYLCVQPDVHISKTANPVGPVSAGDTIGFDVSVNNTGPGTATNVVISDPLPGTVGLDWSLVPAFPNCAINGAVGSQTLDCSGGAFASLAGPAGTIGPIHVQSSTTADTCGTVSNTATVSATNESTADQSDNTSQASVVVECDPPGGGEGCTPGFWKQAQHFPAWTDYSPGDSFETVFLNVDVTLRGKGKTLVTDPTLLEALNARGGGINALARHGVAALLNASNPDVSYDLTAAQVTQQVHDAIVSGDSDTIQDLKDDLADFNEQGCPINGKGGLD